LAAWDGGVDEGGTIALNGSNILQGREKEKLKPLIGRDNGGRMEEPE